MKHVENCCSRNNCLHLVHLAGGSDSVVGRNYRHFHKLIFHANGALVLIHLLSAQHLSLFMETCHFSCQIGIIQISNLVSILSVSARNARIFRSMHLLGSMLRHF